VNRFIAVLSLALAMLALPVFASAAGGNGTDGASTAPKVDTSSAIVQLNGAPLATYEKTHPAQGKKIDFSSQTTKSYRAQLSALRNDFKQWLRTNAPAAKVTGEFDIALNAVAVQLNGTSLDALRAAPQALSAEYEGLYYPVADDPDLGIIDALQAWSQAGGAANAGAGVKVAIVDTGIDTTHPCFSDAGYAPQQQLGDRRFTSNKVIAAKVFNMNAKNQGYTPEAIQDHGTHVSGTVACNYLTPATVNGVLIPYAMSGVAPKALLGNYNVFPDQVGNARSEDIVDALESAYEDGFDVANMSLGGGSHGFNDLLAHATDNLDEANMVVAVAAGNSGPGHFTVESPGKAARALTAGASTVPHFVGASLTLGKASYGLAAGDFKVVAADTTAALGAVLTSPTSLSTACAALQAGSLTGKIAVIARGTCTFSQKIRNSQDAGAIAAIVVNNVAGDPTAMGLGGIPNEPTIPAYMTSRDNSAALIAANGASATISAALQYFSTSNVDIMAGFSSQGPTDVDFRVKPDVVAPGVNVLSSVPASLTCPAPCFAFFQGTSMATPHLAGSAAVVRGQHPTWSAAQVRSAIVNTAEMGVLKNFSTALAENDVNVIGAGRENVDNAVRASVALDPVSVSFGAVPSGAGQTKTATVQLSLGAGPFTVSVGPSTGVGVSYAAAVSGSTITVTMSTAKGAGAGDHQAKLRVLRGASEIAHAAVYTLIK
jgi:minor extracellular serine protease Vpr